MINSKYNSESLVEDYIFSLSLPTSKKLIISHTIFLETMKENAFYYYLIKNVLARKVK